MLIIIQINVDFILPIYSQTYKRKDILKNLFLDSIIIVQKIQGINKRCIRYNRFHKMSFEFILLKSQETEGYDSQNSDDSEEKEDKKETEA